VTEAFNFIRANADKPFFVYFPIMIPHAAMQVPDKYKAPFMEEYKEHNNKTSKYGGKLVKNPVAAFPGMMKKFDEDVGRLLDLLKELKVDDETLVIFTSDNGPHREGGHRPDIFDSNGPLTGLKRSVTEGGIRVPTLARWPGKIKPGSESDHISAFWDFLPTACEMAGVETPKGLDGISFLPALTGKQQQKHKYLYWEFHEQGGKQALRMGKWKAIRRGTSKQADPPILLYNLDEDIAEQNNLADKNPEIVDRMRRLMGEAHQTHPGWLTAAEKQAGKNQK
jgi:arylsulfatase A-like enzyme